MVNPPILLNGNNHTVIKQTRRITHQCHKLAILLGVLTRQLKRIIQLLISEVLIMNKMAINKQKNAKDKLCLPVLLFFGFNVHCAPTECFAWKLFGWKD